MYCLCLSIYPSIYSAFVDSLFLPFFFVSLYNYPLTYSFICLFISLLVCLFIHLSINLHLYCIDNLLRKRFTSRYLCVLFIYTLNIQYSTSGVFNAHYVNVISVNPKDIHNINAFSKAFCANYSHFLIILTISER